MAVSGTRHIVTHYEVGLVCLSIAVAILASYAALDLTRRSSDATGWRRRLWIAAGGGTMGAGIWSMHFVAMLALRMSMPVSYNDWLVALSLIAAVLGATVSLTVVTRPHVTRAGVLSAAAFMGLAVTAMHYLGMASMEMLATIHWQIALVIVSVAIGIVASLIALSLLVRIRMSADGFGFVRRLGAAVLLGFGASGLHYTAMAACTFTPVIGRMTPSHDLSTNALVVLLGLGAGVMLAVLIGGAALDQRRAALASDLTIVATIARELCRVGDTHGRICEAIRELTAADYVLLAESGETARRTITVRASLDRDGTSHPAATAVVSELCGTAEIAGGLHRLADGGAVLYEPLVLDGRPVGILAAGWHDRAPRLPDRTMTLLSMVAAEGAVAIDRESLLNKLEYLARRDELTGLLNRRVLGEELERELAVAHRRGRPLSVVMLDLDHFKSYNDTWGHQAGDRLLKGAAAAWVAELRNSDLIARYGGEEFIVILPECGIDDAIVTARRLRQAVPDDATCSAGVAALEGMESSAQLIGRADRALYHAKALGRNCTGTLSTAVDVGQSDGPLAVPGADRITEAP
jgi:diguanylate cyclase (GGDEF)-like protein